MHQITVARYIKLVFIIFVLWMSAPSFCYAHTNMCPRSDDEVVLWAVKQLINPANNGVVDFSLPLSPCEAITARQFKEIIQKVDSIKNITLENFDLTVDDPIRGDDDPASAPKIDLSSTNFSHGIIIKNAIIEPNIYLDDSTFMSLTIQDTSFLGAFTAENLTVDGHLTFNKIYFGDQVDLRSLIAGSYVQLINIYGNEEFQANNMRVTGYFYIDNNFQDFSSDFSNSVFQRNFEFENADVKNKLQCIDCEIDGNLHFNNKTKLESLVDFTGAHIKGNVLLDGPCLVDKSCLELKQLFLRDAVIDKQLDFSNLTADSWTKLLNSDGESEDFTSLDLTNTKVDSFTDAKDSWPPIKTTVCKPSPAGDRYGHCIHQYAGFKIDGFQYSSIQVPYEDGSDVETGSSTNADAGAENWKSLLEENRSKNFDPQPSLELANFFKSVGMQTLANNIQYDADRQKVLDQWGHLSPSSSVADVFTALMSSFLWIVAGFGIPGVSILHLLATITSSLLFGAYRVKQSAKAKHYGHGAGWSMGAALERLLPIIELRKEFRDFFDEEPAGVPGLTNGEKTFFVLYGLWGWLIGLLFVASVSGLTQGY